MSKYYILDEPTVYLSLVKARLPDGFEIEGPDHPRAVLIAAPTVALIESVAGVFDDIDKPTQAQMLEQRRVNLALVIDRIDGDLSLCSGFDAWPVIFKGDRLIKKAVTERAEALKAMPNRDYVELLQAFVKVSIISEDESKNSDGE